MFAVVEQQQRALALQVRDQRLEERFPRHFAHAARGRDFGQDERRIAQRRQIDEPHAVIEPVEEARSQFLSAARLAEAAGTEQRDEAGAFEQPFDLRDDILAPDEARELLGQVRAANAGGATLRRLGFESACGARGFAGRFGILRTDAGGQ